MKKAEIRDCLRAGKCLIDFLELVPGQECEIFKKDILAMLEEAYRLGRTESEQAATRKHKALIDGLTDQAEWSGGSERGTMESLLDIFEPEELVQLGYGERVKAYIEEYGGDGDWEDINREARS